MGCGLVDTFPVARDTFAEADETLGFALSRLCREGPADELARTEFAQPAILTVSVAAWRVFRSLGGTSPAVAAGHSLGEWSALVAAQALSFPDAVRGVRERGRLMQAAVPPGEGTMAALMGLSAEDTGMLCERAAGHDVVVPANLNGAGQVVVSGHTAGVERVVALAKARGARARRLDVSAPFHSPLMAPAAEALGPWLAGIAIGTPHFPVVTSVEARQVRDGEDARRLLVAQLVAPVRWEETMAALDVFAPDLALEVGPGDVLSGLARRIRPAMRVIPIGTPEGIAAACGAVR